MKSGSPLSRYTGPNLLSPSGKLVDAKTALREADIVAFYVASLSSVSEGHQKRLVEIYHQLATRHLGNLQIVFITHDKTEEEFQRHRKGMPWFSIPFSSTDFIAENSPVSKLLEKDKIRYVPGGRPRVVLFNMSGKLLSVNGLKILTKQGEQLITCLQEEEKASIELQRVPSNMFGFDIGYSWERRFQSLTVYLALMVLPLSFVAWGFTLSMMLVPILNVPFIVYLIWSLFYDDSSSRGNRTPFLRKLPIWKLFVDYFPMRLEKTVDISPKKKYVFCYHPHGILSLGAWGTFATDALGFSEKFPGIDHRLLTLKLNFKTPWVREYFLWHGLCDVSASSFKRILAKGAGSAVVVVVGGAHESLFTKPRDNHLYLERRRGFVREAIRAGAELVPVYAFGENDIYDTLYFEEGSWGYWLQVKAKQYFSFTLPIFHGRGMFFKRLPFILPYRKPVTVVVGKPVPVPKVPEGVDLRNSDEGRKIVQEVHQDYMKALRTLWDEHKNVTVSGIQRAQTLVFD